MVDDTTHIRIDKRLKDRLDVMKGSSRISYSAIIDRYIPSDDAVIREQLHADFKAIEVHFPEKQNILEYMRLIILHSLSLPPSLTKQHDEEVEQQLNDLLHLGKEMKRPLEAGDNK
jgi:hypothetical protein